MTSRPPGGTGSRGGGTGLATHGTPQQARPQPARGAVVPPQRRSPTLHARTSGLETSTAGQQLADSVSAALVVHIWCTR